MNRPATLLYSLLVLSCLLVSWRGAVQAAHSQKRVTGRTRIVHVYDRSITTFDPNGRLLQVEYGLEAANRASPVVAVIVNDEIYVAVPTDAARTSAFPMLHRLDHHLFLVASGLAGDALALARQLRHDTARHRLANGEPSTVLECATEAAILQHALTKQPGARPLGVTAIVLGLDTTYSSSTAASAETTSSSPRLYRSNPGGTLEDCFYVTAGKNQDAMMRKLDRLYPDLSSSRSSSAEIIRALGTVLKEGLSVKRDKRQTFDTWIIRPDKEGRGGVRVTCVQDISYSLSVKELEKTLDNSVDIG